MQKNTQYQGGNPVTLNAFGPAGHFSQNPSTDVHPQHMPVHYIQHEQDPGYGQELDIKQEYQPDPRENNTEVPLLLEQKARMGRIANAERQKYFRGGLAIIVSLIVVFILFIVWTNHLFDFSVQKSGMLCQGVRQFIPHLRVVSIFTLVYAGLDIFAILLRRKWLLFSLVGFMFITFCYRIILVIVWLIATNDTIIECVGSTGSVASQVRYGFWLNIIMIFFDFMIKLTNFYLTARITNIHEFQELYEQPEKIKMINVISDLRPKPKLQMI